MSYLLMKMITGGVSMNTEELKVGYESALGFWRGVRAASEGNSILEAEGHVYGSAPLRADNLARRALVLCGGEPPLSVAITPGQSRHHNVLIQDRVWKGRLGSEQVFDFGDGVLVCRMPAVLAQMGATLDEVELAQIAHEMSGTYGLTPWTDEDAAQDLSALVDVGELRGYALSAHALGARGAAQAASALSLVVGGSNSPSETDISILLMLSRRKGGYHLPGFALNKTLAVPKELWEVVGSRSLTPDFLWPCGHVVEFNSRRHHGGSRKNEHDEARRRIFERMDLTMQTLTTDVLHSDIKLAAFMDDLAGYLKRRRHPASEDVLQSQRQLRNRLFGPEETAAALHRLQEFPD
jgi:hypothetical protein